MAAGLCGSQVSCFFHQLVLKSAGVGTERGGVETDPAAGHAPVGHGGKDLAQDGFGVRGLEPKARGDFQGAGNGGFGGDPR